MSISKDTMDQQDKNREHNLILEFVAELFNFWDEEKSGFIPLDIIVKDMMAIGLAPSNELLVRMISIVLKMPIS